MDFIPKACLWLVPVPSFQFHKATIRQGEISERRVQAAWILVLVFKKATHKAEWCAIPFSFISGLPKKRKFFGEAKEQWSK